MTRVYAAKNLLAPRVCASEVVHPLHSEPKVAPGDGEIQPNQGYFAAQIVTVIAGGVPYKAVF